MVVASFLSPTTSLLNNLLINTIGWTILLPTMPALYASFGVNTATIGTLVSFVAMLTFASGTVQGLASDYFGRLVLLKICAFSQLCGHLIMMYSLYVKSFPLFVLARCIPALFKCCMVVSQAFLFDVESRQENKVSNLGTLYACSNLAFIIGPLIGGSIVSRSVYHPNLAGCVLSVVELVMLSGMRDTPKAKNVIQEITHHNNSLEANTHMGSGASSSAGSGSTLFSLPPALTHLLHVKFAFQLSNSLFEALFPQHGRSQFGLSGYATGLLFSLSGGLSAFTNMFVLRRLLLVEGVEHYLYLCVAATGVGLYVWALWSTFSGLVVAMMVITVSSNLFQGILQNAIVKCLKETSRDCNRGALCGESGAHGADIEHNTRHNEETSTHHISSVHVVRSEVSSAEKVYNYTAAFLRQRLGFNLHNNNTVSPTAASNQGNNAGAVFGLSASADRAARVISPLLGGVLIHHYHTSGLVFLVSCSVGYGLLLLSGGGVRGARIVKGGVQAVDNSHVVSNTVSNVIFSLAGALRCMREKSRLFLVPHVGARHRSSDSEHDKYL